MNNSKNAIIILVIIALIAVAISGCTSKGNSTRLVLINHQQNCIFQQRIYMVPF